MSNEKTSLLKPYTNNDRINAMSVEDKAKFLCAHSGCGTCAYNFIETGRQCKSGECYEGHKQWLESEAEK